MQVPTYASNKQIYDPKADAIVSLTSGVMAMFQIELSPLLAILAIVAGIIGMIFGVKTKRWGWFVGNLIGCLLGLIYIINYASGTFD